MLKLKYLFENFELAMECLKLYDYDRETADAMIRHFRISSNAIYPFRSGTNKDRVCFLRLSPVEEKATKDVVFEVDLISWLLNNGCNVMKPVQMTNGKYVDVADTRWGEYNVSCFERVFGEDLESVQGTIDIVRGYGECLGRLHQIIKQYPRQEERRSHIDLIDEIRIRLLNYGAPRLLLDELNRVESELARLSIDDSTYGLIHYDFEPDNVFYDAKTDTFSIIDFDDAIRCWFALDVVRALDALDDVVEIGGTGEEFSAFVEGYRKACEFTNEQINSLPLMRRLVRLQEYSTLLYVMSEPTDYEPDWLVELKTKLKYKLGAIEREIR